LAFFDYYDQDDCETERRSVEGRRH